MARKIRKHALPGDIACCHGPGIKALNCCAGVIEMRLGYSALRPNEYKAIKSILEGKDVFVTLPTGSGKSLCYAIFAFDDMYSHVNSIALIVSPLKALMKNQVSPLIATLMVI